MALFYTEKKLKKTPPHFEAQIQSLDYQGLGVAKIQGKTWFVENALPAERVVVQPVEEKRQYGLGKAIKILQQSSKRLTPHCPYYGRCGGCQMQHIDLEIQRKSKEQALFQRLQKLQSTAIDFQPMIKGEPWHYRRRAKLSLFFNPKTKKLDIGFRQKNTNTIVNIDQCAVLEPALNALLPDLLTLLNQFSQPKNLGHVELVAAENGVAMLLRVKGKTTKNDTALLNQFAQQQQINFFLQDDEEILQLWGDKPFYSIGDIQLQFDIRDFIQVNQKLNEQMVAVALQWLELEKQDNVLDLFCGMGNFTLPLAQKVKNVVGIEGVENMVKKARLNGEQNAIFNVQFFQADLDKPFADQPWAIQPFNKILLDPPRTGAAFALQALSDLQAEKILYVSCNPATLVRDAQFLLETGYRIDKSAVIDMFPHTGHLESITLFSKQ